MKIKTRNRYTRTEKNMLDLIFGRLVYLEHDNCVMKQSHLIANWNVWICFGLILLQPCVCRMKNALIVFMLFFHEISCILLFFANLKIFSFPGIVRRRRRRRIITTWNYTSSCMSICLFTHTTNICDRSKCITYFPL